MINVVVLPVMPLLDDVVEVGAQLQLAPDWILGALSLGFVEEMRALLRFRLVREAQREEGVGSVRQRLELLRIEKPRLVWD